MYKIYSQNTSPPSKQNASMKSAYATNLEHLFVPQVKVWAHGHTHWSGDQIIKTTRVVSNQVGKHGEHTGYNSHFVIDL